MANKISTVVNTLLTAVQPLVTAGTLKRAFVGVALPETCKNAPELGVEISEFWRDDHGRDWIAEITWTLVVDTKWNADSRAVIDVVKAVQAALDAKIDSAEGAGGNVHRPRWQTWGDILKRNKQLCGAQATQIVTVTDPL
jgi:hypothetical protein